MPKHGHEALEATLVLHGGYSDEKGEYNQKDAEGFIKINSIRLRKNN